MSCDKCNKMTLYEYEEKFTSYGYQQDEHKAIPRYFLQSLYYFNLQEDKIKNANGILNVL